VPARLQFTHGRWAAGIAATLAVIAMVRYPGGTFRDHSTHGYSLSHNFLSDLGATVAHNGQPNGAGTVLFIASLAILVFGLGGCLIGLIRLYSRMPASRPWALAAGAVALVVCTSFIGVAVTPENRVLSLHILFTKLAFRAFPLATLFMALASRADPSTPKRVTAVWIGLTAILAAYVWILDWGPSTRTPTGLVVQVVAQKVVAISAVLLIVFQTYEADRELIPAGDGSAA
jgi:hypothetical membrane protein